VEGSTDRELRGVLSLSLGYARGRIGHLICLAGSYHQAVMRAWKRQSQKRVVLR
jgi:hypothetical protein